MDNSGSMDGMGHHIGSLTAFNILDTFSNNDYVNVLNYSSKTNYTIPCFQDMLVQATKENINVFKDAISALEPEGKTNLAQALEVAFDLLAKYRHKRGCEEDSSSCNQAIMVITDDVNGNLTDVVYKYNRFGSNIPVRIFTYLIGKEVSNVAEGKWLSCANRGYFTHVQSLEQVTEAVLQYITVIARPLVLQGEEHPVSWTHAYADLTYDDKNDNLINTPYRLLTSAAIPCYDTKTNKMNDTRTAYLLGVVGTDVPLDEFERLTVPYKIGVNGYVFIVSNNGYVLMHPDLRPVYQGILKDNYNSIDLTQVEQHDSNETVGPRQVVDTLAKLRQDMVDGKESSLRKVRLKYHYDDMKRVYESAYDYYYTPLENTPFTIGIGIPHVYGNYTLEVENEILRNKHTGINLTSFFNGKWKIHPKWVYCKYHYLEGHEFPTPEKELLHFLGRMYDRDFQFQSQYEENVTVLQEDSYYCDEQLIQRLIFDAKITHESFGEKRNFSQREITLFEKYNASLRFVATMSGLTRWGYIFEEPKNDTRGSQAKEFGDFHPRAINEKWYKSAVLQHQYDESLVYSVPFDAGMKEESLVTGSFAIFPSEKGLEAPGSVVGFQFSQSKLHMEVKKISSKLSNQCSQCQRCNDTLDCYIIDASGYIIVSDDRNYTGRFFGEVEGDIMESMLDEGIFKQVTVFDYQALCKKDKPETSRGVTLLTPLTFVNSVFEWMTMKLLYAFLNVKSLDWHYVVAYTQEVAINVTADIIQNVSEASTTIPFPTDTTEEVTRDPNSEDGDDDEDDDDDDDDDDDEPSFENAADDYYPCEKQLDLFVLRQEIFIKGQFQGEINRPYVRNYYIKRVPNSNLYFVAIENRAKSKMSYAYYSTLAQQITKEPVFEINLINTTLLPCQKLYLNNMPRRRLTGCYNEHPLEREIVDCGRGVGLKVNLLLLIILSLNRFVI
nr:unnamed protein product [Callosobruchus analis]